MVNFLYDYIEVLSIIITSKEKTLLLLKKDNDLKWSQVNCRCIFH